MINRKLHVSVKENKLDVGRVQKSFALMLSRPRGKWLVETLDKQKVECDLLYVAGPEAIPGIRGRPAGYCEEAPRGKRYKVYVVVGYRGEVSEYKCPLGHTWIERQVLGIHQRPLCPARLPDGKTCGKQSVPGFTNVTKIVDRPVVEVAKTTFHELLHAWFMTAFPTGTGHEASLEPEVNAFGITTYSERGYDPRFLEHIKAFAKEVQ